LQEDGTHVLGTVLNDWRPEGRASQHSRYYRQYTQEND
jgi:hypothetical protein